MNPDDFERYNFGEFSSGLIKKGDEPIRGNAQKELRSDLYSLCYVCNTAKATSGCGPFHKNKYGRWRQVCPVCNDREMLPNSVSFRYIPSRFTLLGEAVADDEQQR